MIRENDDELFAARGPRLSLRYLTPADARPLFELGSDEQVTRFFSWGPYEHEREALAYIESLRPARIRGERLELAIVDADDRPIGITGLSELSQRDRRAVVGTWLGRPFWGTGANAESKALVLALAFRKLGLLRVSALANPANGRSIRALERLGFVQEGVLRAWHLHPEGPRDCAVLRLMHDEFEAGALARTPGAFEGDGPAGWVTYSQRK